MKMVRVCLAGASDEEIQKFKDDRKNFNLYTEGEYDRSGIYTLKKLRKHIDFKTKIIPIIKNELEGVRQCDFLVAIIKNYKVREDIMTKIVYCYMSGKPVYLIYEGKLEDLHDWVLNFSRGIYKSVDSLLEDIK